MIIMLLPEELASKTTLEKFKQNIASFCSEMHTYTVLLLATTAGINRYTLEATIAATVVNENTE